ncbi:MAG: PEP-CTERM system TPR-repeat protein PrsT [Rhodocyclaceae bacterium]
MKQRTRGPLARAWYLPVVAAVMVACSSNDPQSLLADAQRAMDKRDYNAAVIQVKNALQKDANNGAARVLFARLLLEQRDPAAAVDELRKAQSQGYAPDETLPLLARALNGAGQSRKVIDELAGQTLSTPAAQAGLAVELGRAYLTLGRVDEAREQLTKAQGLQPDNLEVALGFARLQAGKGDLEAALRSVEDVIAKHPDVIDAQLLRGELLVALRRMPDATAQFQQTVDAHKDDPRPLARLVALNIGQSQLTEAEHHLTTLVKLAPSTLQTVYLQSLLALRQGKWQAARDASAKVLRAVPDYRPSLVVAANANIRIGDQLQAQAMLQRVLKVQPDWALPRKLLAESYVAARNADDALETLAPLQASDPDNPDVLSLVGQAYLLKGDFARSTAAFTKVAALRPDSAQARMSLGVARLGAGDDAHAMQELEAATQIDASRVQIDAAIVGTYLRKGQTDEALKALAALEKRQPDNPLTYNIKGQVMLAMKKPDEARAAFERGMQLQPGNLEAAIQLSRLDLAARKPDDALGRFRGIVEKEPKNVRAWVLMARLQADTGADPKAVRATLEKAIDADPTQNEARAALVQLLVTQGQAKDALNVAQQAQAASPDEPSVLRLLGAAQTAAGERQQAVSTFAKLQTLQPQSPTALIELADAQMGAGDRAAAEQTLRRALELNPSVVDAQTRLIGLMMEGKRVDDALEYVRILQKNEPDRPEPYMYEGRIRLAQGRPAESTQAWQKAYTRGRTPQALMGLYSAYIGENKPDDARRLANEWLHANPKDVTVRTFLAMQATAMGQYNDAVAQYKAVLALTPGAPVALNNLAWAANRAGDPKALDYAEAALAAAPRAPQVMETAGQVFLAHGQQQRGLDLIRQAATLAPQSGEIRLGLARALASTGDKNAARKELQAATAAATHNVALKSEIDAFAKTL